MDKRRIIYALLFLVLCLGVGFAIYWVFFKSKATTPTTERGAGTSGQFPVTGEGRTTEQTTRPGTNLPSTGTRVPTPGGGETTQQPSGTTGSRVPNEKPLVTKLTDVGVVNPAAAAGGGARFYSSQDGKFYKIDANGNVRPLTDTVFYNVQKVTWSPTSDESIIEYPDGANIYYNFSTKEQVTLPNHWESFSFAKNGTSVAAKSIGLDPENRWLISSDPKGNNIKLIEPMGNNADKVIVDWSPNNQVVALSATGEALGSQRQEILLVGQNHENYKSLVVEGRGLQTQWSPDGGKLLHSVYNSRNDYKPELWIMDATPDSAGANRKVLNVNTWASKCTMADARTVYCGVPETLETGVGFAPALAQNTPDRLYKIDTETGAKSEITMDGTHTIDSMFVGQDGKTLYFTDRRENGIFQVPLR
ncbi:MAG: hypothetical protein WCW16_05015 [Candidatus Magasanikbacteria bacterium]